MDCCRVAGFVASKQQTMNTLLVTLQLIDSIAGDDAYSAAKFHGVYKMLLIPEIGDIKYVTGHGDFLINYDFPIAGLWNLRRSFFVARVTSDSDRVRWVFSPDFRTVSTWLFKKIIILIIPAGISINKCRSNFSNIHVCSYNCFQ